VAGKRHEFLVKTREGSKEMAKRKGVDLTKEIQRLKDLRGRLNYQFASIGPDKKGIQQIVRIMKEGTDDDKYYLIKLLNGVFCYGSPRRRDLLKYSCEKYGYQEVFNELVDLGLLVHSKQICHDLRKESEARVKEKRGKYLDLRVKLENVDGEIRNIVAQMKELERTN
jgi:hypothetical protein